ncbi:hypothetical protein [Methanocella conradii]|uniref:hypothetical protein n=1 Tax=Methanocella conradii TaxID=1175444 RepID=UPI00157C5DE0|nr:hypothetical protein [Methanocella conradii]
MNAEERARQKIVKITPCIENGKLAIVEGLKDESLEDSENLPAPEIIANRA